MKKYQRGRVTLYCGDCRDVLPRLKATSFDASLNDPPHGRKRADWDRHRPPVELWQKVFRVLKPGAHMLTYGGHQTFFKQASELEDAGFIYRDCLAWVFGPNYNPGRKVSTLIEEQARKGVIPATLCSEIEEEVERWKGYRTLLKDGWEPLLLTMRPTDGGFAKNVLKWGCGGLNSEGCRIPSGRLPTNLMPDEKSAERLDVQGHAMGSHSAGKERKKDVVSKHKASIFGVPEKRQMNRYGDGDEVSRFFYCPKASEKDKGDGNDHITPKPLRLCEYLARLLLPPKRKSPRRIIVPFAGSGSEMIGALRAGWDRVIGIEIDPKYFRIACKRLDEEIG